METISLNPESVAAYKALMTDPASFKLKIPALAECFEESETATPKHILYKEYLDLIQKPLPKVFFYIIMDELYHDKIALADTKELGYKLVIKKQ